MNTLEEITARPYRSEAQVRAEKHESLGRDYEIAAKSGRVRNPAVLLAEAEKHFAAARELRRIK
jgi:hypothetical protein